MFRTLKKNKNQSLQIKIENLDPTIGNALSTQKNLNEFTNNENSNNENLNFRNASNSSSNNYNIFLKNKDIPKLLANINKNSKKLSNSSFSIKDFMIDIIFLIDLLEELTIYNKDIIKKDKLQNIINESEDFESFKKNYKNEQFKINNSNNLKKKQLEILVKNKYLNSDQQETVNILNKRIDKIKEFLFKNGNITIVHIFFFEELFNKSKDYSDFKNKYSTLKNNVYIKNKHSMIELSNDLYSVLNNNNKNLLKTNTINTININFGEVNTVTNYINYIKKIARLIEKINNIYFSKETFDKLIEKNTSFNNFRIDIINSIIMHNKLKIKKVTNNNNSTNNNSSDNNSRPSYIEQPKILSKIPKPLLKIGYEMKLRLNHLKHITKKKLRGDKNNFS